MNGVLHRSEPCLSWANFCRTHSQQIERVTAIASRRHGLVKGLRYGENFATELPAERAAMSALKLSRG
jgi:hypothetical protein